MKKIEEPAQRLFHVRVLAESPLLEAYLREQIAQINGLSVTKSNSISECDALIVHRQILTPAEKRVLQSLMKHDTISEAADDLVISEHTIKKHLEHIYTKLEVHSLHRAIVRAIQFGVLD